MGPLTASGRPSGTMLTMPPANNPATPALTATSTRTPVDVLQTVFGYPQFRGDQAEVIDTLVAGGDALVLMPTGGGKSLCYQVPALVRPGTGVVISPLIALMQDQVSALAALGVRAAFLNSTQSAAERREVEQAYVAGDLDLLYLAPERLSVPSTPTLLDRGQVALFAIDEAHCVSSWGHDFRPDYLQLAILGERWPDVPRVALTATATRATAEEIVTRLGLHDARTFVASFDRPNIEYRIVSKDNPRAQLLRSRPMPKVLSLSCSRCVTLSVPSPRSTSITCIAPKRWPVRYTQESSCCAASVPSKVAGGSRQLSQLPQAAAVSPK